MRGVFAFLFVFVFIGAADAVQSCLALNTLTECGHSVAMGSGLVDWSAECAKSYTIRGIAGCSVSIGSYARADKDLTKEVYCFCKVYAPFESGWQYAMILEDAYSCRDNCAYVCADGFVNRSTKENEFFREKIIVPVN
ncbi:MAG: hypothetical protein R8M70_00940 [Alphaproteobacteria bacterium]|nr:hypothetical protein [Alphaproteobacteria bacterium]